MTVPASLMQRIYTQCYNVPHTDKEEEIGIETAMDITVRSTEIDVNGHVNNAKYLEYLEWGREDWYERLGLHYDRLLDMGVITVVVHVSADFRLEAKQNDKLTIRTRLSKIGNTSFTMKQSIDNQREQRVLDAEFVIVTVDARSRQKTEVPSAIRDVLVP